VKDSAVQELMKKIKYVHPPEMGSGLMALRGKLVAKLRNGEIYSRMVDIAKGSPQNPLSREELIHKYRDCVQLSLSPEDSNRSLDLLLNLESIRDVATLTDIYCFKARLQG